VAECATLQVQIMSLRDSFCVERAELEDLVKGLRAEQMRILAEKDAVEVQLKTALRKIQQSAEPPTQTLLVLGWNAHNACTVSWPFYRR
jgi:hypothetical protein